MANPKIGCAGLPESANAPEDTPQREGDRELEASLDKPETLETYRPELTAENCSRVNPEAHSNGLMELNIDDVQEDGSNSSKDRCGIELSNYSMSSNTNGRLSTPNNLRIGDSNQKSVGNSIGLECSSNRSSNLSTDPSVVCLFRCCSQCLLNLQCTLRKMLSHELGLKKVECMVEDAYDFLASLAAHLHSALRIWLLASNSTSLDEKRVQERYSEYFSCKETNMCGCRNLGDNLIKLRDCDCHLKGNGITEKCKSSQNLPQEVDTEFILRDGVLTNLDKKDVSTLVTSSLQF